MLKCFLTDNSATVGRILMIFLAGPHEILILIKWWKNQPSSTSASAYAQILHYTHSKFWPIFAQKCFGFCDGKFFPSMGNPWKVQGSISIADSAMLGEHLSQKLPLAPPYNPKIWPKTCPGGGSKILRTQKNKKIFFLLWATRGLGSNLCAAKFPHYKTAPVDSIS